MSKNLNAAGKNNDKVCTPETIWKPWARALERFDLRFTLDPCGCEGQDEIAVDTVYLPDDGLDYDWRGHRVWLNPPYSQLPYPAKYPWLERAQEADLTIAFLPARTSAPWFRDAVNVARCVWFLDHRVTHKHAPLNRKTGEPMSAPFAQCFLQFGTQATVLQIPQEFTGWGLYVRLDGSVEYVVRARTKVRATRSGEPARMREPLDVGAVRREIDHLVEARRVAFAAEQARDAELAHLRDELRARRETG